MLRGCERMEALSAGVVSRVEGPHAGCVEAMGDVHVLGKNLLVRPALHTHSARQQCSLAGLGTQQCGGVIRDSYFGVVEICYQQRKGHPVEPVA